MNSIRSHDIELSPSLVKIVADAGGCWHCALRAHGFHDSDLYRNTMAAIQAARAASGLQPLPVVHGAAGNRPCTLCFGLLPVLSGTASEHEREGKKESGQLDALAVVTKAQQETGHEMCGFRLSLSLPACISVREHAVLLAAREEGTDGEALIPGQTFPVDVKYALQPALASAVGDSFGVPFDLEGELWFEMSVRNPAADLEASELLGMSKSGSRGDFPGGSNARRGKRQRRRDAAAAERERDVALGSADFRLVHGHTERALKLASSEQKAVLIHWARKGAGSVVAAAAAAMEILPATNGSSGALAEVVPAEEEANGLPGARLDVVMRREGIFLQGRYVKLSREVPQSPWTVDDDRGTAKPSNPQSPAEPSETASIATDGTGAEDAEIDSAAAAASSGAAAALTAAACSPSDLPNEAVGGGFGVRKGLWSVHEIVTEPFEHLLAPGGKAKFHGSGREDIDVRMLGEGRPFVMELANCRRSAAGVAPLLAELEAEVNELTGRNEGGLVRIHGLAPAKPGKYEQIGAEASEKRKWYGCLIWSSGAVTAAKLAELEAMRDLKISQKTPLRVLHRRTLAAREKVVHSMQCERINAHFFVLRLATSAGTYVKEFVHGDLGRTTPSICTLLGCQADLLQLDVDKVQFDAEV